jgi:hypothetical protein
MANEYLTKFVLGRSNDVMAFDSMASQMLGYPMAPPQAAPMAAPEPSPSPAMPGTASPNGGSSRNIPGVAGIVFNEFVKAGLPENAAYGVLGNGQAESGFNPRALNQGEGAEGIFQHRADRRDAMHSFAAGSGGDVYDPAMQARFAAYEMKTKYPEVWAALQREDITPEEAATIIDRGYEKSDGRSTAQRQRYARAFAGGDFTPYTNNVTMSARDGSGVAGSGPITPAQLAIIRKSQLVSPIEGTEDIPDMSIKAQRRAYFTALGTGFFKGLGDIGHGKSPDLAPFLEAHQARQDAMRQRMLEIRQAQQTAAGREALLTTIAQEHPDLLDMAASGEEGLKMAQETMVQRTGQQMAQENLLFTDTINDVNMEQEQEIAQENAVFSDKIGDENRKQEFGLDITKLGIADTLGDENRTQENTMNLQNIVFQGTLEEQRAQREAKRKQANETAERTRVADTIRTVYGSTPWGEQAALAALGDPKLAQTVIDNGLKQDAEKAKVEQAKAAGAGLAEFYRSQGYEDVARYAEQGMAKEAADLYKQYTGTSSDAQTWEYAKGLPADERADFWIKQGIKAGVPNAAQAAALDVRTTQLKEQSKVFTNYPQIAARIDAAMELMGSEEFVGGGITNAMLPVFNTLQEYGWNPFSAGTTAETAFEAMMQGTISLSRQVGEGSMTEGDAARIRASLPNLSNAKAANAVIGYTTQVIMARAEAAFNAKLQYVGEHGTSAPAGEKAFVEQAVKQFNKEHGYSEDTIFLKAKDVDEATLPDMTPVLLPSGTIVVKGIDF